MKRLFCTLVLGILMVSLSFRPVFLAQGIGIVTPIQTGFVVVTPIQGVSEGLSVSETFGQNVGGSLFQASVLSSPPVTLTDIFIRVDPATQTDTGIAIVNPNNATASLALNLSNDQGSTVATRTLTIGGLQQISRFVTELFAGTPELANPFSGLMLVSSDIPLGVMGLAFVGPSFTSLPAGTQLTASTTMNSTIIGTTGEVNTTIGVNNTSTTTAVNSTGGVPTTITAIPSTVGTLPSTFVGLPPVQPITVSSAATTFTTAQLTGATTNGVTTNGIIPNAVAVSASSILANGAILLPQFATGGGWSSQIVIANTSTSSLVVSVDIFNSSGGPLVLSFSSSLSNVFIPPGGVVTFNSAR